MGFVVAARHVQLGSLVALKFMLPEGNDARSGAHRFLREARAAARLRGEHIARVSDFGTLETGAPYIVMEFLEGQDLEAVVRERGPLPCREVLAYMLDACEAMDEAHQQGIVHRDLKPKNLFLTQRPNGTPLIKVLDFGISKLVGDLGSLSTQTNSILGSPPFMAPEQFGNAKHVDARADIYALGAVMYYLLTKNLPYDAETIAELVANVLFKEPRPLRALRADAPPALESVVSRCLKKNPNERFSSVRELMAGIRSAMDAISATTNVPFLVPSTARVVPPSSEGASGTGSLAATSARSAQGSAAGSRATRWAAIAGAISLGTAIFFFLHARNTNSDRTVDSKLDIVPTGVIAADATASVETPPLPALLPPQLSANLQQADAGASPSSSATHGGSASHGQAGTKKPSPPSAPVASSLHYGDLYEDPHAAPAKR